MVWLGLLITPRRSPQVVATDRWLRDILDHVSRVLSSGLVQHLRSVAQMMEATHPAALRLALEQIQWTAIIAEVSAASAIAPITRANQVPLLILAFDPAQARAAHTAGIAAVLIAHDPALSERLVATLSAIATETMVNSHWRNIGSPRGLTRKQARGWAREEAIRVSRLREPHH